MAISDRIRKLLWGRSGNRCAICRHLLSLDPTSSDPASVVGDECHIVAQSVGGPRGGCIQPEQVDQEDNLILLCRTDHKRVDDQPNYFSSERLRAIKIAHETWVRTTLDTTPPSTFDTRLRPADPNSFRLKWISTGSDLFAIVAGAMAYDFDHDELKDENEVELVGVFLQTLQDYGEIDDDLEAAGRVRARFELTKDIERLGEAGFWVYGGQVPRVLEANGTPLRWPVATIRVKRVGDLLLQLAKEAEAEAGASGSRTGTHTSA